MILGKNAKLITGYLVCTKVKITQTENSTILLLKKNFKSELKKFSFDWT